MPATAQVNAEAPIKIMAFGDSLTAGYGLAPQEAFPAQLEALLQTQGRAVSIENAGVSGETTAGGIARLDWALASNPQIVLLALGANDALRGLSPAEAEKNLASIIETLQKKQIKILLVGMQAPRNLGPSYAAAFDPMYQRLADKYKIALWPFMLEGVAMQPALNQADGLHPNAAGAKIMAERAVPYLLPLLAQ